MNTKKLKELAHKNDTAGRILDMVAERRRNTMYTAFSGLRADLKRRDKKAVDRKDFNKTFQMLERLGAGKLQCTPRGTCQGFYWSIPIRDVGAAIKGKSKTLKKARKIKAGKRKLLKPNVPFVSSDAMPLTKDRVAIVILRKGKGAKVIETDENNAKRAIDLISG